MTCSPSNMTVKLMFFRTSNQPVKGDYIMFILEQFKGSLIAFSEVTDNQHIAVIRINDSIEANLERAVREHFCLDETEELQTSVPFSYHNVSGSFSVTMNVMNTVSSHSYEIELISSLTAVYE